MAIAAVFPSRPSHLFDLVRPLLGSLDTFVCPPEQSPLPLFQAPQKLLLLPANAALVGLAGMQPHVSGAHHKGPAQHGAQLALVKQVQHAHAHAVHVDALVAQGHGARVGAQGGHDGIGQAGRQVECQRGLGVLAGGGEGQHLGEPQGQAEGGARLEAAAVVVEVAEVGDVELEGAGDFLRRRQRGFTAGLGLRADRPPRRSG